jgi:hypothetical protein
MLVLTDSVCAYPGPEAAFRTGAAAGLENIGNLEASPECYAPSRRAKGPLSSWVWLPSGE